MSDPSISESLDKEIVSTDTKVETKSRTRGSDTVEEITITTTKKTYSDGSATTKIETKTETAKTISGVVSELFRVGTGKYDPRWVEATPCADAEVKTRRQKKQQKKSRNS